MIPFYRCGLGDSEMLQDLSNISLLAELELKLRTVDSQSCVLTVLKWGKWLISKQASKQTVRDTTPWILGWRKPICRNPRKQRALPPTLALTLR